MSVTFFPASRAVIATFFIIGGILHFVFPRAYIGIMPTWLPWHAELVFISGVCEIAGGIGILSPVTRRAAAIGLILLSIAVLPANVQMLASAYAAAKPAWAIGLLLLRLPLQVVLILWIWRSTRPAR